MDERGQTLIELLYSLSTVVLSITAAGWLLKIEWDRGRCAYVVFEQTHAQVSNSPPISVGQDYGGPIQVQTQASQDSVDGTAQCGQSSETVSLPQLDPELE